MSSTAAFRGSRNVGLSPAVWGAIYLGVAAATLPDVLPVMVGVLAGKLGFGVVRAGYVASANMAGLALGSVLCAILVRRWSWQTLICAGAATMIGTNFLTMLVASFPQVATLRLVSGVGEGVVAAICYAAMGQSRQPERALAFYVAGQGLVGALGMGVIPGIVERAGWPWLFVLISVGALPAFWLARPIGALRVGQAENVRATLRGAVPWLSAYALAGILVFFVGMSAVWAFVERMGHAKAIDLVHLSIALSASSIANMAGSLLVGVLAHRLSTVVGVTSGLAIVIAGLLILIASNSWQPYLVGVSMFFFVWGFYYPFQFKLLANVDIGGKLTVLIPVVTAGGLALGPAIGGLLLAGGGAALVCAFGIACVIGSTAAAVHLHFYSTRIGAIA